MMNFKVQSPIKVLMLSAALGSSVALGVQNGDVVATYSAIDRGVVESIINQSDEVLFFEALFRTPAKKRHILKNLLFSMNHEIDATEIIRFSDNLELVIAAFAGSKRGPSFTSGRTAGKSHSGSLNG